MLNSDEKLLVRLNQTPFEIVRSAFIQRSRIEKERVDEARNWLIGRGYEEIDISKDQFVLPDGREILWAQKKAWVLSMDVHNTRLKDALNNAHNAEIVIQTSNTARADHSVCTRLIDLQLCGGRLYASGVCGRSALGKAGVIAIYTCDTCGNTTAILRDSSNG